jgi:hypothetical protein
LQCQVQPLNRFAGRSVIHRAKPARTEANSTMAIQPVVTGSGGSLWPWKS